MAARSTRLALSCNTFLHFLGGAVWVLIRFRQNFVELQSVSEKIFVGLQSGVNCQIAVRFRQSAVKLQSDPECILSA